MHPGVLETSSNPPTDAIIDGLDGGLGTGSGNGTNHTHSKSRKRSKAESDFDQSAMQINTGHHFQSTLSPRLAFQTASIEADNGNENNDGNGTINRSALSLPHKSDPSEHRYDPSEMADADELAELSRLEKGGKEMRKDKRR